MFTDSHNHLHVLRDPVGAGRAMLAAGVEECVVNSTSPADWEEVAALALALPGLVRPAFGVHPWLAHTAAPGWRGRLAELLERHPAASLGECGLDRGGRAPPLPLQMEVFGQQLGLARQARRPLTIHCVRAWGALFEALDRAPPPAGFLMHSFQGSAETAARLARAGAFFSPPARPAEAVVPRLAAVFRSIPPDRILLETDAPGVLPTAGAAARPARDAGNDPARLPVIAAFWAELLGTAAAELAAAAVRNHRACFGE